MRPPDHQGQAKRAMRTELSPCFETPTFQGKYHLPIFRLAEIIFYLNCHLSIVFQTLITCNMEDQKSSAIQLEVSPTHAPFDRAQLAAEHTEFEKSLSFWATLRLFWRSTLWIAYGQLVVFGYGIDGIIAGTLLTVPKFR